MSEEIIREEKPEENIAENLDEVMKNIVKDIKKNKNKISKEQITNVMKEANENLEFLKALDDINLSCPDNRTIYVDGNEELIYDNGEFFLCDTIEPKKSRKKLKRKEAVERYIEYFIRFQLNPIIEQKKINNLTKTVVIENKQKVNEKVKSDNIKESKTKIKEDLSIKEKPIKKVKEKVIEKNKQDIER
ncbi:MAG: hypothetical protein RR136_05075 [Clostridia bacterium]